MIETHKKSWIRRYLFSTDHKVIAIQYLITGLLFLAVGGILAYLMRFQLAHPWQPIPFFGNLFFKETGGILMPEVYPKLFTMHGGIMVFFAVTPILLGALGNYTIPLEIGARDMAFPRLNMISYWSLFLGCIVILVSFFVPGGAADAGWTLYTPLSSSLKINPNWGIDLFILGLALDAVSILAGGVNYIVTIIKLRVPGMKFTRMPLTNWGLLFSAILNTLWLPLVAAALFMILADRRLGTGFFIAGPLAPHEGGQVLLFQHLFWGFGHPEVYILILPVWGFAGDLLSVFSRKPAFGYLATVISMAVITFLSGIVWGHHMFTSGMNPLVGKAFMFLTITVSVPTAIFFFNWLGTLWRGSIQLTVPMLFTLGVVFVFAIGGLSGLFFAVQTLDIYFHDTYFVVGHFHFTLAASLFLGLFAFITFWFPKMFGRELNPALGKIHFWASFILVNIIFFSMMYVGLHGHMRRIADATAYEFLKPIQPVNIWMGKATGILVLSQLLFVVNFFFSLFFGKKAEANPWQAASLAWTVSSPPPEHNFEKDPVVYCGPHEYGMEGLELKTGKDFLSQDDPLAMTFLRNGERKAQSQGLSLKEQNLPWISITKLGMWVFLVSEIMLFTGLVGSYIVLRLGSHVWPNPAAILNNTILGINTFILICSSLTFALGIHAVKEGRQKELRRFLLITAFLGLAFITIKLFDYHHLWHEGVTPAASLFGACYYLLTGFHGLHVFSGVVVLLYLWFASRRLEFCTVHGERIEASGLYWHFIDIVWIILFAILCLV